MAATRNIVISYVMLFALVGLCVAASAAAAELPRRMLPAVAWRTGYSCCFRSCSGGCAQASPLPDLLSAASWMQGIVTVYTHLANAGSPGLPWTAAARMPAAHHICSMPCKP